MAGDWIKMRGNLWDDPRVGRLCDLTDSTEGPVIGALYWLWATADQHTEDGCMPGLTLRQIDRKTGLPGFAAALVEIGWLRDDPQGVVIVKFQEHNGESAKRRSTDAKRKAASRAAPDVENEAPPQEATALDTTKRKSFSPAQKYAIFSLDRFKCVYCGRHKDDPVPANRNKSEFCLSIDHLVPHSKGGSNDQDNLVTACLPCNMSKNGRTPEEWGVVPDLSARLRTEDGQGADALHRIAELEKELEKEKREKEEALAVVAAAEASAQNKAPKATLLPQGWMLPKGWGDWALSEFGWSAEAIRIEAAKFADFWHGKSGKDATKRDWEATWRNWCRNARVTPNARASPASTAERDAEARRLLGFTTNPEELTDA